MTASPSSRPIRSRSARNRMDVVTNGRKLSRELMDGVKPMAKSCCTMNM